jgi:hypothetical protein
MNDARPKTGLDLSLVQVVAGTAAALTAALLGSLFGIAGTLLGTAVGSTVGTVCTAVYTHQLRRTRDRLHQRASVSVPVGWPRSISLRTLPWLRVLASAAVVFGVALMALTVLEASLGRPLSSATRGPFGRDGGGTSLGRALAAPDLRSDHPVLHRSPAVPVPGSAAPVATARPDTFPTPTPRLDAPPPTATNHAGEQEPAGVKPGDPPAARVEPSDPDPSPPTASETTTSETPPPPSVDPFNTDQPTMPPSAESQP